MNITAELQRRHLGLQQIMQDKNVDVAVIIGNSSVGTLGYGCFRYFTDWRCYYHLQAFIARPGKEPTVCVGTLLHLQGLHERGFNDILLSPDILGNVMKTLQQQKVSRLGVNFEMLPTDWYLAITKAYPNVEIVDLSAEIYNRLRSVHSEEELRRIRKSAEIADAGYEAVCKVLKPGVKLSDLHAELDYTMMKAGAEEVFTLMSNGKFKYYSNDLACLQGFKYPDDRVVKEGDTVGMEITPRYNGYWTQLVRTVCVSEPNEDLMKAHKIQLDVIEDTRKMLLPGTKLGDLLKHMWATGENLGFIPKLPFGHVLGLDLDEGGRGSLESDFILGEGANVVLHPTMTLGEMNFSIFWGDNYIVTKDGGERINKCSTELRVL
ncbi:MAG: M24 family metallopeptidase [Clostridia bacterium]|nr:M24 family metallopeptidase [Clostridia bacterium]